MEVDLRSRKRKKKSNKYTKKNARDWHTSIEISKKSKGRKASKINYESKYKSHENMLEDEVLKVKKKITPLLSHLQLHAIFADKLHIAMRKFGFHIPEDLLIDRLLKLPLKSLARFKCVSKTLQQLISNSILMPNAPMLLIFSSSVEKYFPRSYWNNGFRKYSYSYSYSFCSLDDKTNVKRVTLYLLQDHTVKVHSSCNGLLLMQIDDDLLLWNPLTDFFFKKAVKLGDVINWSEENCNVVKVVLVVNNKSCSWDAQNFYVATCEVSSWKIIKFYLRNVLRGPFFKGYRYWISGSDPSTFHYTIPRRKYILYFEPSTNKFITIAKPQPKEGDIDGFLSLEVYDGCLCVTRLDEPENYKGRIELLVMKEYGNGNSWEVMFVFSNSPEFRNYSSMEPLFKTKGGEVWVAMDIGYRRPSVKAYDVHGNFIRDVWTPPDNNFSNNKSWEIILYEQSWFSPMGYDRVENLEDLRPTVQIVAR